MLRPRIVRKQAGAFAMTAALAMLLLPATTLAGSKVAHKASKTTSGTFTFSGGLSGSVKLAKAISLGGKTTPGCQIERNSSIAMFFASGSVKIQGHTATLGETLQNPFIQLTL